MKLSEHFTLEELTFSETASRRGINNEPSEVEIDNLKKLATNVLEPIRQQINLPIHINSGYRSPEVNLIVGGKSNSQHLKGEAADMVAIGLSVTQFYNRIKSMFDSKLLQVDQCIIEYNRWVHISYREGKNRNQFFAIS
jgi:uncharacterized protein YcbK (DUF882 family)